MDHKKTKIVADGAKRAYDGSVERVRAEIEAEYAQQLREAGVWRRFRLRRKIRREIKERMSKIAPKTGLY